MANRRRADWLMGFSLGVRGAPALPAPAPLGFRAISHRVAGPEMLCDAQDQGSRHRETVIALTVWV